ncbi:hypothetical protein ACFQ9X_35385 [Catenulispora yoronensis]
MVGQVRRLHLGDSGLQVGDPGLQLVEPAVHPRPQAGDVFRQRGQDFGEFLDGAVRAVGEVLGVRRDVLSAPQVPGDGCQVEVLDHAAHQQLVHRANQGPLMVQQIAVHLGGPGCGQPLVGVRLDDAAGLVEFGQGPLQRDFGLAAPRHGETAREVVEIGAGHSWPPVTGLMRTTADVP